MTPSELNRREQEVIAGIACEHLGIETLEDRGSDRLDFHDLAAGAIRLALESAFLAGCKAGPTGILS